MLGQNINRLLGISIYRPLNTIEISKKNLFANYRYLSKINPKIKVSPVLKSNAYGHGIREVGKILDQVNCPFFCVDSLYEAYELLKTNIQTPILIMGHIDPENLKVKKLPFSYAVCDLKLLQAINEYQPEAGVHLFIDTGMHREGISLEQLPVYLNQIKRLPNINLEGLMSHLATAEDPKNPSNREQANNFSYVQKIVGGAGFKPKWIHLFATKSFLHQKSFPKVPTNMARIGMGLFGIDPTGKDNHLKPVLTLKSKIIQIKKVPKESLIGYSGTYRAKKDMTIGILPIGYFDGVDRRLSNRGVVLVNGVDCPIIGLISMNVTTVDLSQIESPKVGDEVVVFSNNPADPNSIINATKFCKTISYELLVHLDSSTKRVVV